MQPKMLAIVLFTAPFEGGGLHKYSFFLYLNKSTFEGICSLNEIFFNTESLKQARDLLYKNGSSANALKC